MLASKSCGSRGSGAPGSTGPGSARNQVMIMKTAIAAIVACVWLVAAASPLSLARLAAQTRVTPAPIGPAVGVAVPNFSGTDQFGTTQTLERVAGPKGAMLVFFRSADW